jgi:uncharacterized protein (TIGR02145 family)
VDIDGNVYGTIGIGSQIWMSENLKTSRLNDGTRICLIKDDSIWQYHDRIPATCWYNNDSVHFSKPYGLLYNGFVVSTDLLCPTGWHVPSDSDWDILTEFLGGYEKAGGKLKDYNSNLWSDPNHCYVNDIGFFALPGGRRDHFGGRFYDINDIGYWWTSSSKNELHAYSRRIFHYDTWISKTESNKRDGFSVRCIKNN